MFMRRRPVVLNPSCRGPGRSSIHQLLQKEFPIVRLTAWDAKIHPTCADAIAVVRRHLWDHWRFSTSPQEADMLKVPRALFDRFIDVICYAA
jgi:hypothetical protein